ncbi:glycosyltransferase family 4 protein [Gracilimonas sp. Q87]|uniref:glycosyltransferase family 4 protein n=1 Tax=Gracilimonas sp. Q87 TaxID=3384766 RepID=UPI0039843A98
MSTKVLIIGKVWPEPNSSAAGSRMVQIIELFREQGWSVTFVTAAAKSPFMADLESMGVKTYVIKLNDSGFDEFIRQIKPDIVLYDRFMTEEQFGWRVREQVSEAMTILDTEDLHCLRQGRRKAWNEGREFDDEDLYSDIAKREVASILRSDLSIMISEIEMSILSQHFEIKDDKIIHVPFLIDSLCENDINQWQPYDNRKHFISIGNFLHEPNWNAVLYLKEEIWPKIRERLPDSELHIYGAYPSQKVEQLHNEKEGFLIKGRADDAKKVVSESRVLLAPLRFGAGLKGKLIEAMQCGTPSITTPIGAEGMHDGLPWPGAICNDPNRFAEEAVRLYTNKDLWEKSQILSIDLINTLYDKKQHGDNLTKRIYEIRENLSAHRMQHFTGEILHHHKLGSTKYMSKWIEAKNKIKDL